MKKLLSVALVAIALMACHSDIWDSIEELKKEYESLDGRVAKLEELCKEMNTNITALQTLVNAQQTGDYITAVTPITKDGKEIGYVITFAKSTPITIYHGNSGNSGSDGQGSDGLTPIVGVAQDTDGIYYWTLNGTWMLDDNEERIPVTGLNGNDGNDGSDGAEGTSGKDGRDGKDGKDGITPQLKIENDYWYISYDNGLTWAALGKATGEDGSQGEKGEKGDKGDQGEKGDSMFRSVTQDETYVYFILNNGTTIKVTKLTENGTNYFEQTVMDHIVDSLIIDRTAIRLFEVGQTDTIIATTYPFKQSMVTWESSNPEIATVENGVVTAKGFGVATITITAGTHIKKCTIRVNLYGIIASYISGSKVDGSGSSGRFFFSQGNLQYQASKKTWRFAEHQYDYIGIDNENKSAYYSGWIDLFGWGTSGWYSGATAYQPYSTSNTYSDYLIGNNVGDLRDSYARRDWGVYNSISNGGNKAGLWRTPISKEWSSIISANGKWSTIMGVNGVLLFPDDWEGEKASYTIDNMEDWEALEDRGVVFLPCTGYLYLSSTVLYQENKSKGEYWASTSYDNKPNRLTISSAGNSTGTNSSLSFHQYNFPVRLIINEKDIKNM